jgi:hypothetical protein
MFYVFQVSMVGFALAGPEYLVDTFILNLPELEQDK